MQFFYSRFFLKKRSPRNFFGTVRQKNFREKVVISLSYPETFSIKESFWKEKGSPTKFFGTVRKAIFDKNVIHHLMQFFNPEFFSLKRATLGIFSVLWDKKISRENRDSPFLSKKIFDKRNFLKKEGFPYKTFWYSEKINFRQNRDTPSYAIFLTQNFSETRGSS